MAWRPACYVDEYEESGVVGVSEVECGILSSTQKSVALRVTEILTNMRKEAT